MFIYNKSIKDYKIVGHKKSDVIKGKGVEVTSTQRVNVKKLHKIKKLQKENVEFLKQLGFKVIKK